MHSGVVTMAVRAVLIASLATAVGSKRWCAAMRDKVRGDWTANEALDYARHCVLAGDDDKK